MSFSVNLGSQFLKTSNVGRHFYPDYQGFYSDFHHIKTFTGALVPPASQPPTTLLFITVS